MSANSTVRTKFSSQGPDVPWLYVLNVLVNSGGFAKKINIATAADTESLLEFLKEWAARNSHIYAGRYQIDNLPFVSDIDG